jgi:hypothetical protein
MKTFYWGIERSLVGGTRGGLVVLLNLGMRRTRCKNHTNPPRSRFNSKNPKGNHEMIKPTFHHVNLKTTRLQEMIDWYGVVIGATGQPSVQLYSVHFE